MAIDLVNSTRFHLAQEIFKKPCIKKKFVILLNYKLYFSNAHCIEPVGTNLTVVFYFDST